MANKTIYLGFALVSLFALVLLFTLNQPGNSMLTGNLVYEPSMPIQEANSTYSIVPAVGVGLDYSMTEIGGIIEEAKALAHSCSSADAAQVDSCVASEVSQRPLWQIVEKDSTGFIYAFEVKSSYKLPAFNETEKKIEDKEIVYKFALDFSS